MLHTYSMIKSFPLGLRAKTTALKQPKEVFSFARDINGEWIYGDAEAKDQAMSYYYLPDSDVGKHIDLGAGVAKFKKIPDEQNVGDFPALLKAIKLHEEQSGARINTNIVSFRGLMTKLLVLPYNLKDAVSMYVVPFDGQLFVKNDEQAELARRNAQDQDPNANSARFEYVGYKFEAVATLPKPWAETPRLTIEKRNKKLVNNYEQYISVVKTGIGKAKVLLAGEVDCVFDYVPEDPKENIVLHYAELKTSRVMEHTGQVVNFEKKLFRTWAQSFLLGVGTVIYGFRDDKLLLQGVEVYKTEEIPVLIKDNKLTDQGNKIACTNALKWYGAVIEWLVEQIDASDESKAYKISYDPGSRTFSLIELDTEEGKKVRAETISEEFSEWRKSQRE